MPSGLPQPQGPHLSMSLRRRTWLVCCYLEHFGWISGLIGWWYCHMRCSICALTNPSCTYLCCPIRRNFPPMKSWCLSFKFGCVPFVSEGARHSCGMNQLEGQKQGWKGGGRTGWTAICIFQLAYGLAGDKVLLMIHNHVTWEIRWQETDSSDYHGWRHTPSTLVKQESNLGKSYRPLDTLMQVSVYCSFLWDRTAEQEKHKSVSQVRIAQWKAVHSQGSVLSCMYFRTPRY